MFVCFKEEKKRRRSIKKEAETTLNWIHFAEENLEKEIKKKI